jgi:hypothetical protein
MLQAGFLSVDEHNQLDAELFDPSTPNCSFRDFEVANSTRNINVTLYPLNDLQIEKPSNGTNDILQAARSNKSIISFQRNSSKNQLSIVSEKNN